MRFEIKVQEQEDDQQRQRDHHLQLLDRTLHVLELATPGQEVARLQFDLFGYGALRVRDVAADVAPADVDEYVDRQQCILGADGGWPLAHDQLCKLAERHHTAVHHRYQHVARNAVRIGAQFTRITNPDAKALPALDGRGDHVAAEAVAITSCTSPTVMP